MKVLIIGLGSIAKKHIAVLQEIDSTVEFVALRSSGNCEVFEYIRNIYDWDAISQESPDFILISNPTSLHFETLQKLKSYSIPLFIEKPLFSEIGAVQDKLVQEITNEGIPTYVACNLRFLDSIREIRNIITNERVNEINVYCGSYLPNWRPEVDFRTVYSANKEMGGGVHIDLIHELDYVYWLFGTPKDTQSFFRNNSSLEISAFDYANYLWEYNYFCVSIILNYYRRQPKRNLEIVCEAATYNVDLRQNSIMCNDELLFKSSQSISDTYKEQMLFFIHNIVKGKETFNTIKDAYNVLKLCLKE